MGRDEDYKFTFDTKDFEKAVKHISSGMDTMVKNSQHKTANMSKSVAAGMAKFAVMATAIVSAFKYAFSAIKQNIPELGVTASIASKIIMKNLLNPLRKELIPHLQKMLQWVMKNRTEFVKFGAILVNVFKFIKQVITTVAHLFQPIINQIRNLVKSIFGDTGKTISETINLIIFKLTALFIGVEAILKPTMELLGRLVGLVIEKAKGFWKGFFEGFSSVSKNMDLLGQFNDLLKSVIDLLGGSDFGGFAKFLGVTLATALSSVIKLLQVAVLEVEWLARVLKNPMDYMKISTDIGNKQIAAFAAIGKVLGDAITSGMTILGTGKPTPVQDAVITADGKVIKPHRDDTITLSKSKGGAGMNVQISIEPFTINVTQGDARAAGESFGAGLETRMRRILLDNLVAQGAF